MFEKIHILRHEQVLSLIGQRASLYANLTPIFTSPTLLVHPFEPYSPVKMASEGEDEHSANRRSEEPKLSSSQEAKSVRHALQQSASLPFRKPRQSQDGQTGSVEDNILKPEVERLEQVADYEVVERTQNRYHLGREPSPRVELQTQRQWEIDKQYGTNSLTDIRDYIPSCGAERKVDTPDLSASFKEIEGRSHKMSSSSSTSRKRKNSGTDNESQDSDISHKQRSISPNQSSSFKRRKVSRSDNHIYQNRQHNNFSRNQTSQTINWIYPQIKGSDKFSTTKSLYSRKEHIVKQTPADSHAQEEDILFDPYFTFNLSPNTRNHKGQQDSQERPRKRSISISPFHSVHIQDENDALEEDDFCSSPLPSLKKGMHISDILYAHIYCSRTYWISILADWY